MVLQVNRTYQGYGRSDTAIYDLFVPLLNNIKKVKKLYLNWTRGGSHLLHAEWVVSQDNHRVVARHLKMETRQT